MASYNDTEFYKQEIFVPKLLIQYLDQVFHKILW